MTLSGIFTLFFFFAVFMKVLHFSRQLLANFVKVQQHHVYETVNLISTRTLVSSPEPLGSLVSLYTDRQKSMVISICQW